METFRTLLVDDDSDSAEILAIALEARLGPTVVVPDAYQALHRMGEEAFDAVVLEVALPGASGIQLLERLTPGPPAVVLTWLVSPSVTSRALAAGAHAVAAKPCPPSRLAALVRAAIASHGVAALLTV